MIINHHDPLTKGGGTLNFSWLAKAIRTCLVNHIDLSLFFWKVGLSGYGWKRFRDRVAAEIVRMDVMENFNQVVYTAISPCFFCMFLPGFNSEAICHSSNPNMGINKRPGSPSKPPCSSMVHGWCNETSSQLSQPPKFHMEHLNKNEAIWVEWSKWWCTPSWEDDPSWLICFKWVVTTS